MTAVSDAVEDIENPTTNIRSPRTNGFVGCMNHPLLEAVLPRAGAVDPIGVDEIQRDLDRFVRYYCLERRHQGYRLKLRSGSCRKALQIEHAHDTGIRWECF